jgi:peptidoglycan/LPS O-acetylase OafA/YrhL
MNFDLMRLVAALLVVVSHTFPLSGQPAFRIWGVEDLGALGVSIFFVISGYLVSASYLRDPKTYLIKRVLRIEPGLIAALVVTVLALSFVTTAPAAQYWPAAGLYVLKNAVLYLPSYQLPGVFETVPLTGVVNGVLWTLRLEFTFYLVLMLIRARLSLAWALAAVCAVVWLAMRVLTPDWAAEQPTRIAFLARATASCSSPARRCRSAAYRSRSGLGALSTAAFPLLGPLSLPTAVIGLARPGKLPADLSYGVYIYAFPIQQLLAAYGQLNLATAVAGVLPFAALSWFLVESRRSRSSPGRGRTGESPPPDQARDIGLGAPPAQPDPGRHAQPGEAQQQHHRRRPARPAVGSVDEVEPVQALEQPAVATRLGVDDALQLPDAGSR